MAGVVKPDPIVVGAMVKELTLGGTVVLLGEEVFASGGNGRDSSALMLVFEVRSESTSFDDSSLRLLLCFSFQ